MSTYAQSRDLNDPKTIRDFAAIVQSPERLRLLLILTVADIRAVGPGVWNGWKGQLLRTLYAETEPLLAGDVSRLDRKSRSSAAAAELSAALPDWSKAEIDRFVGRHHHAYWVRTDTAKQAEHAKLMRRAETDGARVATDVKTDAFTAITELTVLAPNDRGLLALLAGACAAAEANIVGAHISTTRDGLALDTFLLQRTMSEADEHRRAARIGEAIERLMAGETTLEKLFGRRKRPAHRLSAFDVEPEATINNALSDEHSVVEVAGLDRPGLLHELTSALSELGLDINSAHVATYGEKAIDVFYVTDAKGQKVADENRREAIRARLASVLAGTGEARADLVTNR